MYPGENKSKSARRGYFVTGTDTGVGKTLVSALICAKYGLNYWKPIQAGDLEGSDTVSVRGYADCIRTVAEQYRLRHPLCPSIAARKEKANLSLEAIRQSSLSLHDVLVEGAGGLMVPINNQHMIIDVIKSIDFPAIIVAKNYLGCINHTLMTVNTLRAYGIAIAGIVFNQFNDDTFAKDNINEILHFARVPNIGVIPPIDGLENFSNLVEEFGARINLPDLNKPL